jgi:hypothetical protein
MKLDRNVNGTGRGKYGLIKQRRLEEITEAYEQALRDGGSPGGGQGAVELSEEVARAINTLERAGVLDWGPAGTESEFFVIKLRDEYARDALSAYATAARVDDPEYAAQVYYRLACKAGPNSPFCKKPD